MKPQVQLCIWIEQSIALQHGGNPSENCVLKRLNDYSFSTLAIVSRSVSHRCAERDQICFFGMSWSRWRAVPTRREIGSRPRAAAAQIGVPHCEQNIWTRRLPLSAVFT